MTAIHLERKKLIKPRGLALLMKRSGEHSEHQRCKSTHTRTCEYVKVPSSSACAMSSLRDFHQSPRKSTVQSNKSIDSCYFRKTKGPNDDDDHDHVDVILKPIMLVIDDNDDDDVIDDESSFFV